MTDKRNHNIRPRRAIAMTEKHQPAPEGQST